ncbi:MAG: TnsA endonuclease N-terminal domain-containing protein [Candidatus Thiodiazotropha endolucinida]
MARRKLKTLKDYSRSLKNGYGVGEGAEYLPWLRVVDVPSKGKSSKPPGIKIPRTHQLLSKHELNFFLLAEFNPGVSDIREQFPLLPLDLVIRLASEAGIDYPHGRDSKDPCVLTTDFLLTLAMRRERSFLAVAVKTASDLLDPKVRSRLELERLWWNSLEIPWRLVTDEQLDKQIGRNLEWFSDPLRGRKGSAGEEPISDELITDLCSHLEPGFFQWSGQIDRLSQLLGLDGRFTSSLLKAAIWYRKVIVDLETPIQDQDLIHILKVVSPQHMDESDDAIAS